jgi:2-dehydro-3-deoxy-D-arabinonate dehydratase
MNMRICRFKTSSSPAKFGLLTEDASGIFDLSSEGILKLGDLLEQPALPGFLRQLSNKALPRVALSEAQLCVPVDSQEVWAAGVTYLRSKKARMEESNFSATAYDRVYDADRPELFFKSLGEKAVGPAEAVGIRADARWNVPEPELALVCNSRGSVLGYTIGNDMSARDIEGENLLYLPQAKIYDGSCALGPWIEFGSSEAEARTWTIGLTIHRRGKPMFEGSTAVAQLKRNFSELASFLFRSQRFPHGAILLTGTGVVPPDNFTLEPEDIVRIDISGIGTLQNTVRRV